MGAVRSRSVQLKADCSKCCGLCCVGPTFYADQGFGFDKPAHTPCANLRADFRCAIHDELGVRGFPACATFDCYGAGQRVTQQLFGGKSWRSSPDLAPRMFDAYYRYRALHELMALLELAAERVSWHEAVVLRRLGEHIDELCESGAATISTLSIKDLRADVLNRIRGMLSTGLSGVASDDTLRERPER